MCGITIRLYRTSCYNGYQMQGELDLDAALAAADCVVVVTDYSSYDWAAIQQAARTIVDTRHAILQRGKQ